ncbi:MAG: glycosyltransferase family 4 protein, partial [bacterium]|nr:glycosyltransferase family 4 protein [bacterium]
VALPFVLAHVHREIPEVRMRIIGFTPESEPEVVALFQEHGLLAYVDFVGVKRSDELPPYYARAEVLVVPSAYEGLPCVILEAMRSGLPVVATRVSGHPEAIVDGENGFLVDLDRPEQMAERCVRILHDRALRQRLGEAARHTIRERFTLKRQVREYLGIYERLSHTRNGLAGATDVGSS